MIKRSFSGSNLTPELQSNVNRDMELMSEQKIRAIYSGKIFLRTDIQFWETAVFFFLIYSSIKVFRDSHPILGNLTILRGFFYYSSLILGNYTISRFAIFSVDPILGGSKVRLDSTCKDSYT